MRTTIRLADGSLVEGELVMTGTAYVPYPANAAACAPNLGAVWIGEITVNGQARQPAPKFPPPAAACACVPTPSPSEGDG